MTHRIYDCQIFYNELDLLEIRLGVLDDQVDRFVILESPMTLSGRPKPLFFRDHRERFARWESKIVHHVVELPSDSNTHERERLMRNAVLDVARLDGAAAADVLIIADADEIVSPAALAEYSPRMGLAAPEQLMSQYWINCVSGGWAAPRIATVDFFQQHAPDTVRRGPWNHAPPQLIGQGLKGGWHLTFLGGATAVRAKIQAYGHQELNIPEFTDPNWIDAAIHTPFDIFARPGHEYRFCPLDDRFPRYLVDRADRFSHLWKDAWFHERWTSDAQLIRLFREANRRSRNVSGIVIEIGSWEGRSTVVLAHARPGETVFAVDTWQGNLGEGQDHSTVQLARQRDVFGRFQSNVRCLTQGNVSAIRQSTAEFFRDNEQPIAFAYIDGSHDYNSVFADIRNVLGRLPSGGTICGDDFESANAGRVDLNGGVERAVRELVPGFEQDGNFWIWTRP